MKKLKNIGLQHLNKWIETHEKNAECIDCIEGVLLDSLLYSTPGGLIAFIETYETANSSTYTVIWGNKNEIFTEWEKLKEE